MSKCDSSIDLDELKTFYDPHPGLRGAVLPIPLEVKKVAGRLNGKTLSLREALSKIREVTTGKVEVVGGCDYISLDITTDHLRNFYCVIRYK